MSKKKSQKQKLKDRKLDQCLRIYEVEDNEETESEDEDE